MTLVNHKNVYHWEVEKRFLAKAVEYDWVERKMRNNKLQSIKQKVENKNPIFSNYKLFDLSSVANTKLPGQQLAKQVRKKVYCGNFSKRTFLKVCLGACSVASVAFCCCAWNWHLTKVKLSNDFSTNFDSLLSSHFYFVNCRCAIFLFPFLVRQHITHWILTANCVWV